MVYVVGIAAALHLLWSVKVGVYTPFYYAGIISLTAANRVLVHYVVTISPLRTTGKRFRSAGKSP